MFNWLSFIFIIFILIFRKKRDLRHACLLLRLWHLLWIFSFQSKIFFWRNFFFFYGLWNLIFHNVIRFNKIYFLLLINFNFLFRWFNFNFSDNLYILLNLLIIFWNNFCFILDLSLFLNLSITKHFRLLFFYLMSIRLYLCFFRNLYLLDTFMSFNTCLWNTQLLQWKISRQLMFLCA